MTKTIRFLSLALAFALAGCNDDGGSEPTPTIAVTVGGTFTVVQGQTGTTQVTVTRGGGFTGAVTLTTTALPVGVTAAFDPATIPAGSGNGTSTLTLTAGENAPTGNGTYTVSASGGTGITATANGTVTIQDKPDFSLNITPNVGAVDQGSAAVFNVAINRSGGFAGAVNLSVANLPTGVTAGFDNAAPTGNTAVLTLTAAANAALGPAVITVNGTGTPGTHSATLTLTVQTPPGSFTLAANPTTISIAQGAQGQSTVTVNKTGSFTGAVALTVTGLPTGVTASFDPPNPSAPQGTQDVQTTSALTLTVAAGATLGDHPLVIHGNAQGQTEKTVNLTLTVTQVVSGGYTLSTDPDELTIVQGANAQTTVTISKTGTFTGNVTLSVTGLPAGATATFAPPAASPRAEGSADVQTTSVLTITVGAAVVVNTYPLVIHGAAEGLAERTNFVDLTVSAAPVNGFTIALNPTALSVEAGQNGQVTVNINKTGTFNQNVPLSVTNLPVGITAAFNPVAASAGKSPGKSPSKTTDTQTQSTLTLTVANTVAAQEYNLNVRGAFEGLPNQDAALTLTVTPAPGGYTLESNPSTLNVQAGQAGQTTILVKKTGSFTGNVALSVTGLPANVTAAFNPTSASPPKASATRDVTTESVLTLTVAGSVAVQNYALVVHGAAQGQDEQTVAVNLNVTAPPGPGNSSIKFCDLNDLPIWFAYKDGNGAWTQVTGVVAGDGTTYTYNITQPTGAIAYVTGNTTEGFETNVQYATQAQLTGNNGQCPAVTAGTKTINGSVAGVGATDQVSVVLGGSSSSGSLLQPTFQLTQVQDGALDLISVRNAITLGPPVAITPMGIIIRRGLNIANNGTLPVLDFSTAEAFVPATASITVNNAGAENLITSMSYITPTTQNSISNAINPTSPVTMHGIPAAKQEANDLHQLNVIASNNSGEARGHFEWFKTLANKTVDLGTGLTAPTITKLATAPYVRYSSSGTIQAIYDDFFTFSMNQSDGATEDNRSWTIVVLQGVFTGNYTMTIEDLTGAGYQALWGLKVGALTSHQTQGVGFSNNGTANPIMEGGKSDFATRVGEVTP